MYMCQRLCFSICVSAFIALNSPKTQSAFSYAVSAAASHLTSALTAASGGGFGQEVAKSFRMLTNLVLSL